MISHVLAVLANEVHRHFVEAYGAAAAPSVIAPGNIAEGIAANGGGGVARDLLVLTIVNLREEKALRNLPSFVRDEHDPMRARYENPPIHLNLTVLLTATHTSYSSALLVLSRVLRFFQHTRVFTHDSVAPASLVQSAPPNSLDRLNEFKLVLDLCSPSLEEANHMWGTLGGKQYPFALFNLSLVDLKFEGPEQEAPLIGVVERRYEHLTGAPR